MQRTELTPMPFESECRRTEFFGGTAVTLADGDQWTLAKPFVRVVPDPVKGTALISRIRGPLGDEFEAAMKSYDALWADGREPSNAEIAESDLWMARLLLLANYQLTDEQLARLLQFGYDEENDPDGCAMRRAVVGVAFGEESPKPSTVGGDAPSSPTV